jgi:uracil-DNA glycosylase family 4
VKPASCLGCSILAHGADFSAPEGTGSIGVAIVGEASGEGEARELLPFRPYMPSGSLLERTIRRLGMSRDQFAISNACRCKPLGNLLEGMPYEFAALDHCRPNLLAFVSKFKPRVLVALGNIALRSCSGWHGEKKSVSHLRGYVLSALPDLCAAANNPDLAVVPSYHPAFLRRGAVFLSGVLARDIARAVNVAKGKDKSFILDPPEVPDARVAELYSLAPADEPFEETRQRVEEAKKSHTSAWMQQHGLKYILHPTMRELDDFCRDVKSRSDSWAALSPDMREASPLVLSTDLETRESSNLDEDAADGYTDTIIEQIQFSVEVARGIAFPWRDDFILAARWLLKLPLAKAMHHGWLFDMKVLRAVGQRSAGDANYFKPNGTVFDTLQEFHAFQPDLPANLQFAASFVQFPFPWKHLADSNLPFYGLCDTDATLRVHGMVRKTMEDRGIWYDPQPGRDEAGYVAQTQSVRPVLADMEDRGLPVDDTRRLALDKEFDAAAAEVFAELDERFPEEARKIEPKEGYATIPPEVRKLLGIRPKTKAKKGTVLPRWPESISVEEVQKRIFEKPGEKLEDGTREEGDFFRYMLKDFVGQQKWCRVYEFSPNSAPQLIRYMQAKRHKIPTKKGGAQTTEKKELERLASKHSDNFYFKVIEYRELTKMRGTYIDGYKPHADGRVHTTFTFDTATGQLSSRRPNCQNAPARSTLADAFRGIIRHPEKLIVEWDYKSFHVLTTGFEAKDASYMRMARLDMHSFIAWHFLRLPGADELYSLPDDELREKLEWFKTDKKRKYVRDKQAKPCIAEGELVLTDRGLVPIEKITLEHRLWDGVEWVTHGGLIYQGVKEVITYDGLTATKCHKVVTRDGCIVTLEEGMRGMVKLESTGPAGQTVRTRHRNFLEASAKERILGATNGVFDLQREEAGGSSQPSTRADFRLQALCSDEVSSPAHLGSTLRRDCSQMYSAYLPSLQALWGAGHRESFRVACSVRELDSRASAARELYRSGDRSREQRWTLRAWEFETGLACGADAQSPKYCMGGLQGRTDSAGRLSSSLRTKLDEQTCQAGAHRRNDYSTSAGGRTPGAEGIAETQGDTRVARVYDIVNAGPRRCYTVSGRLVLNCILGIGFGLGVEKMFNMNLEHFSDLRQAKKLKDMVQQIFPRVFKWQDEVRAEAHQQTYLKTGFGAIRWFYEVYVPDGKGGWRAGEQSEQAIALKPANDAHGHIRSVMRQLDHKGLCARWEMVNAVHDSVLFLVHPKDLDEHIHDVYPILTAPSKVLIDPVLAPSGLAVDVEASAGVSWAKADLKELKIPAGLSSAGPVTSPPVQAVQI